MKWAAPPSPWDGSELYAASLAYGDLLAEFAEAAERDRRHVGRGECWDLANEGLQSLAAQTSPAPMKCIGRTHGHLIYSAKAGQVGVWRGGENAIRRGDVVQWLTTKIKLVGQPNVTMTLGEPDHTAIVVSDAAVTGVDGPPGEDGLRELDSSCIGPLEVVEQSVKELPTRRTYDMSQFTAGQVSLFGRIFLVLEMLIVGVVSVRCGSTALFRWKRTLGFGKSLPVGHPRLHPTDYTAYRKVVPSLSPIGILPSKAREPVRSPQVEAIPAA